MEEEHPPFPSERDTINTEEVLPNIPWGESPWDEKVDEWELFDSDLLEEEPILTDELRDVVTDTVLENEEVQDQLSEQYVEMGSRIRQPKNEDPVIELIMVDYESASSISIILDYNDLEIDNIEEVPGSIPLSEEETQRAIELARDDEWLAEHLKDEFVGRCLLVTESDPHNPNYGHRLLDVRFGYPHDWLPRYMAIVDLSTESVIESEPILPLEESDA